MELLSNVRVFMCIRTRCRSANGTFTATAIHFGRPMKVSIELADGTHNKVKIVRESVEFPDCNRVARTQPNTFNS